MTNTQSNPDKENTYALDPENPAEKVRGKSTRKRNNGAGMALVLCCIVIVVILWLLGPRIANHVGWIWQDILPDHVDYSGRTYAPGYSYKCLTQDSAKQTLVNLGDGLIQAGSIPAILGSAAPLFVESSDGKNPTFSLSMQVYVRKNVGCYVHYEIEGGP